MSEKWISKITKVEPNKLTVRGHLIDELMGKITFAQMVFLLLKGNLPDEKQGKLLDAILVSSVDHGPTPPSTSAARFVASSGASLSSSIASGILAISKFHGGAINGAMKYFYEIGGKIDQNNLNVEDAVEEFLEELKKQKKRFPGFGHRYHTNDPRAKKLFKMAKELGYAKKYIQIAQKVEKSLKKMIGKHLPINVDGAIAAVLCELGFSYKIGNAFFILSRTAGLVAHTIEEQTEFKPMRKFCPTEVKYEE